MTRSREEIDLEERLRREVKGMKPYERELYLSRATTLYLAINSRKYEPSSRLSDERR